jgi:DNA polymerase (family X)
VDILPDGSLALPDSQLALLDLVIIAIHSRFNLPISLQTQRLLKALARPKVKILAHPTGRLINSRPPLNVDWARVFYYCAKHQIALEINASPNRLDLPDTLAREALGLGVKLALGTDAHAPESLKDMSYAVDVARRSWAAKRDIINTYSYQQFISWLKYN